MFYSSLKIWYPRLASMKAYENYQHQHLPFRIAVINQYKPTSFGEIHGRPRPKNLHNPLVLSSLSSVDSAPRPEVSPRWGNPEKYGRFIYTAQKGVYIHAHVELASQTFYKAKNEDDKNEWLLDT